MIEFDPVFNDLSTCPVAGSVHEANERIRGLISVLLEAPSHKIGRSLRIPEEFYQLELASEFSFNDWIASSSTPPEERGFLLQVATKSPYLVGAPDSTRDRAKLCDVKHLGEASAALQAAHLLDLPLISFDHAHWNDHQLAATAEQLDDEGEFSSDEITLANISNATHFTQHARWIERRHQRQFPNGIALWEERARLFPHLEFCLSVEEQLISISSNRDCFAQVVDRLFDLERVANAEASFDKDTFRTKCSPSSESTLRQFAGRYRFRRHRGDPVTCGWHLYLSGGRRVYFSPNPGNYIIGHIGEHLPTFRYP